LAALVAALAAMHVAAIVLAREPSGVPLGQPHAGYRAHPNDPAVVHAAAEKLLLRARTEPDPRLASQAEALINEALRRAPQAPRTWTLKAWSELVGHRFSDALASASEAKRLGARDAVTLGLIADALVELGRYAEAVGVTQQMLDRFPGLAAWSRAAHLRYLHGDLNGAIELAKQAAAAGAQASEPVAWVLLQLAELHLHRGDTELAGAIVGQVLDWYPTWPQALAQAARVHEVQGRHREALERLRQALREQPTPEHAFAAWQTARRAGDVAEAKRQAALLQGMGRLDEAGLYRRVFAEFYCEFPDTRKLAERLARAELAARPDLYSHATLAWVLFRAGDLGEAAAHAKQSLRLNTPDRELRDRAGTILRAAAAR